MWKSLALERKRVSIGNTMASKEGSDALTAFPFSRKQTDASCERYLVLVLIVLGLLEECTGVRKWL